MTPGSTTAPRGLDQTARCALALLLLLGCAQCALPERFLAHRDWKRIDTEVLSFRFPPDARSLGSVGNDSIVGTYQSQIGIRVHFDYGSPASRKVLDDASLGTAARTERTTIGGRPALLTYYPSSEPPTLVAYFEAVDSPAGNEPSLRCYFWVAYRDESLLDEARDILESIEFRANAREPAG